MALRNILKEGEPRLLKKSRAVTNFDKRLHTLIDDMRETMANAAGLGLAAPQVGALRRVVLVVDLQDAQDADDDMASDMDVDGFGETAEPDGDEDYAFDDAFDDADGEYDEAAEVEPPYSDEQIIELINPELIFAEGEQCGSEGCLSIPGRYGLVARPMTARVRAQDRFGESFEFEGTGMTARAICHELDHLEGVLFTSRMERMLTDEELEEMRNEK